MYNNKKLIQASIDGNQSLVTTLLEAGADPNYTNEDGVGPLLLSMESAHLDVLKVLISFGGKLDAKKASFWDSFMLLCLNGETGTVDYLIKNCDSLLPENKNIKTAVQVAQKKGHSEIAYLLVNFESSVSRGSEIFH